MSMEERIRRTAKS